MGTFAAIQMASGPQVPANLLTAERLIADAARGGAQFIVLPENFAMMGIDEADKLAIREPPGQGPLQDFLAEQARQHGVWLNGGTIPIESDDPQRVYAASLLYDPEGRQVARYDKMHLFDVELLDAEERYHESGTTKSGQGTVVVDTPFGKVGMAVCYDLRFPELFRDLLDAGAEIILLPAAFTALTGKAHWEILVRARAIENLVYVVAAAQGGYHINGRATWGHSMIVDPWGNIIAELDSSAPGVALGEVRRDYLTSTRQSFPTIEHRRISCRVAS